MRHDRLETVPPRGGNAAMAELRRRIPVAVALPLLLAAAPGAAVELSLVPFATGLSAPVAIAHAGDDRLFVVEKAGYIRIVTSGGAVLPTPFLDIHTLVSGGSEQGLLGLAFHPHYASNGFFYVHYTDTGGATAVVRYQVSGDPDVANAASAQPVLGVLQPFSNHNGGGLAFGPDGYLYISLGDGGAGCDPNDAGQSRTTVLGKILRIDVDSGSPYAIPPDNPYAGSLTLREEIWAWGLRNPWRFSFDRTSGDLYIADVGQARLEEIDFEPAGSSGGVNYGWDCFEGSDPASLSGCATTATCAPASQFTFPVHEYDHSGGRCSITGGYVYRGSASPALIGQYFFADFCSSNLYAIRTLDGGTTWTLSSYGVPVPGLSPTTFGEDAAGEVYVTGFNGTVYRIAATSPPCTGGPASGCLSAPKSTLTLGRPTDPAKNKLIWKWLAGPAQDQTDFGDPIAGGTSYELCLFAGTAATEAPVQAVIAAGSGWKTLSTLGYKFADKSAGGDGVFKALLKGGPAGKSKVLVKAKGANLDLTALPLDTSAGVTVQLRQSGSATCWETTFPPDTIGANDGTRFKAKRR